MSTFAALDSAWHNNDTGGYNEGGSKRSLNILMHGTEALSALHRFSRGVNARGGGLGGVGGGWGGRWRVCVWWWWGGGRKGGGRV